MRLFILNFQKPSHNETLLLSFSLEEKND